MISRPAQDLSDLSVRLVAAFEFGEFCARAAAPVAGEGELARLLAAGLICAQPDFSGKIRYTNAIPPRDFSRQDFTD